MRTRALLISAIVGVLVLVCAGGVYAYDHAHAEELGKGVRIGGVDVSRLTEDEARAKLRQAVLEPLNRPVVVRGEGEKFRLTPKQADVSVDIDGSVAAAMDATRDGGILARTWRGIRGEPVDTNLELDIAYSDAAIDKLVKRVSAAVDEPAVDASVDLESGDVTPQPSKDGLKVKAKRLARDVRRRLLATGQ